MKDGLSGSKFEVYNSKSDTIYYYTHQGLGDLISCTPIVNKLSEHFINKKILFIVQNLRYKNILKNMIKNQNVKFYIPKEWEDGKRTDLLGSHLKYFTDKAHRNNCSLIFSGGKYYYSNP